MHTGIGPFDINSGSVMGYAQGRTSRKKALHAPRSSRNILNGDADQPAHASIPAGKPIAFDFNTQDLRLRGRRTSDRSASKHVFTYGGNLRFNGFDLSHRAATPTIAPRAAATCRTRSS